MQRLKQIAIPASLVKNQRFPGKMLFMKNWRETRSIVLIRKISLMEIIIITR